MTRKGGLPGVEHLQNMYNKMDIVDEARELRKTKARELPNLCKSMDWNDNVGIPTTTVIKKPNPMDIGDETKDMKLVQAKGL